MNQRLPGSPEDHRLAGVVEKFNRAKEQFDEFRVELDAFLDAEPEPYFSRGEFDHDSWEWIERFQVRREFPLRLGVILGDCIHNLRSALDHLICQVTLLDLPDGASSDGVCDKTQFPIICDGERKFEDRAKRMIPGLNADHRALVKHLQPYHAGNDAHRHPLAVLASLSNADKHRLVNPTYSFMASDTRESLLGFSNDQMSAAGIAETRIIESGERLQQDTPWLRFRFRSDAPAPVEVKVGANLTIGIGLGDVGLDLEQFKGFAESIWQVIEAFMRDFPETEVTG